MSTQEQLTPEQIQDPMSIKMKYGAPDLKRLYKKYAGRGLLIAVAIHVLLIGAYVFTVYMEKLSAERQDEMRRIIELSDLDTPPPTNEDEPPAPEVEVPEKFIPLKDLEALIPEPVAKEKSEILTTKTQEALEDIKAPVSSEGDENAPNIEYLGKIKVKDKKIEKKIEKKDEKKVKKTYQQFEVEKAPVAVNLGSVRSSMRYPEIARSSGIEGRVTAKVLVGTNGSIVKIGGMSGPSVFHNEVRSKIGSLQFTPALQNGVPVRCWVSVPFNFKLSSKFKKQQEEEEEEEEEESEE
jgi:TonB family protein